MDIFKKKVFLRAESPLLYYTCYENTYTWPLGLRDWQKEKEKYTIYDAECASLFPHSHLSILPPAFAKP